MYTVEKTTRAGSVMMDLESCLMQGNRIVFLTGEINDQSAKDICMALRYLDATGRQDIRLEINSPGGSVTSGMAIVDAMNMCRCDIATICTGMAASMAAFIAAQGARGKRWMTPNAVMMIHQPIGSAGGQASDIVVSARHIQETKEKMNTMLAKATGKDIETIARDTDRDYYLDAHEAVEYGLVDGIIDHFE